MLNAECASRSSMPAIDCFLIRSHSLLNRIIHPPKKIALDGKKELL